MAHNCLRSAIARFAGLHLPVPRGLYHFYHSRTAHFVTFTCYHRYLHLANPTVRDLFVRALERTRKLYRLHVYAFVVMPEHWEAARTQVTQACDKAVAGETRLEVFCRLV